jgi:hypothetical protein
MNAFDQADSIVQSLSGLFALAVMVFFGYRVVRKRKE